MQINNFINVYLYVHSLDLFQNSNCDKEVVLRADKNSFLDRVNLRYRSLPPGKLAGRMSDRRYKYLPESIPLSGNCQLDIFRNKLLIWSIENQQYDKILIASMTI